MAGEFLQQGKWISLSYAKEERQSAGPGEQQTSDQAEGL